MRLFKRALSWLESNPEWLLWAVFTYTMFRVIGYGFIEKELNQVGTRIGLTVWVIVTVLISYKQYKLVRERNYWIAFHEKYGNPYVKISVPFSMWCDFDAHFFLYDENGDVKLSAATEDEVMIVAGKAKTNRLHETKMMNCGIAATIIAYRRSDDMDIKFADGYEMKGVQYSSFSRGELLSPWSLIGKEQVMACGMNAKIIASRDKKDID